MDKKGVKIIFSILMFSLLMINFVSAISLYEGIVQVKDSSAMILGPVVEFLLGDISGGLLLTKILIFIIIILLAWIGIQKINLFNDYPKISKIVVIAFSLLAMKGIGSSETINIILLPYTVTGVALSAGIPFILYFTIVNVGLSEQPDSVRRIAWIFFGVIFAGLLASRIGGIGNIFLPSEWGIYWIYIITIIIAFTMAFLDGTIRGFFAKVEAKKLADINTLQIIAGLKKRKAEYDDLHSQGILTDKEHKRLVENINKKAKVYGKRKLI